MTCLYSPVFILVHIKYNSRFSNICHSFQIFQSLDLFFQCLFFATMFTKLKAIVTIYSWNLAWISLNFENLKKTLSKNARDNKIKSLLTILLFDILFHFWNHFKSIWLLQRQLLERKTIMPIWKILYLLLKSNQNHQIFSSW